MLIKICRNLSFDRNYTKEIEAIIVSGYAEQLKMRKVADLFIRNISLSKDFSVKENKN